MTHVPEWKKEIRELRAVIVVMFFAALFVLAMLFSVIHYGL